MAKKKRTTNTSSTKVALKDGTEIILPGGDVADFAETLRQAIRSAGLTQYQLAKVTGVPQSALSQVMTGKDLRVETFQKLCQVVGLELKQNSKLMPRKLKRKGE